MGFGVILIVVIVWIVLRLAFRSDQTPTNPYDGQPISLEQQRIQRAGIQGEEELYREIKRVIYHGHILRNVKVPTGYGNTTEVDLLVIHHTGLYVFEYKNYVGRVYGREDYDQWVQVKDNGVKKQFYNPMKQNDTHIRCLSHHLDLEETCFYSYIVFSDRCRLTDIVQHSNVDLIMNKHELKQYLSEDILHNDRQLTEEEVEDIYCDLLELEHTYAE